jgi:hypothetical protein
MKKIDLRDCTFIIPLKVDSFDREQNFLFTINYLTKNFDTNIIITETSDNNSLILNKKYRDIINKNNILLIEKENENVFHRTRYLNEMLKMVNTPVTINYDIDVFIPKKNYSKARDLILIDNFDLVYPYTTRSWYQYKVPQVYRDTIIKNNLQDLDIKKLIKHTTEYGHLQFFNTASYIKGYGENEDFISYGPEDKERYFRFNRLGFKITDLKDGEYVFHLEHYRGKDSGHHENYENNENLWEKLKKLTKEETIEYYKKQPYITKL